MVAYDNEYKERAYSVWRYWKEKSLNVCTLLEAIAKILDVDSRTLGNEFKKRYEAEHDSLQIIRNDTEYMFEEYNEGHGSLYELYEYVLKLIDRTVAVMERDK